MQQKLLHPRRIYAVFKYGVYLALLLNIGLFLREDLAAAAVWIDDADSLRDRVEAFAQTIDSMSWVILLLLFEAETAIIPDTALVRRRVRWSVHGVRAVCAMVIVSSVVGYAGRVSGYHDARPFTGEACALARTGGWSLLLGHDDIEPLDDGNCSGIGDDAQALAGVQVLAPEDVLAQSMRLAWTDVVNASTWVLIVLLLEFDVRMQLRGGLRGWVLRGSTILKSVAYTTLLAAAIYWGLSGEFLDFWDAFLWLVAFVFIEMNLFQWQAEGERLEHQPVLYADR